ncbi:MAG: type II toxin-antitoxin system RelE/ParE family toxin [Alkalispirochaeta sp.]
MIAHSWEVLIYSDENGREPFSQWIADIDPASRARIFARLDRIERGNFGDYKAIAKGLSELRFHFGPGYRVYFGTAKDTLVILLAGGDKKTQKRDIKRAHQLWDEFLKRKLV